MWAVSWLYTFICPSHVEFAALDRYAKDVMRYLPLFATDGTFIFELDNELGNSGSGQYASESSSL